MYLNHQHEATLSSQNAHHHPPSGHVINATSVVNNHEMLHNNPSHFHHHHHHHHNHHPNHISDESVIEIVGNEERSGVGGGRESSLMAAAQPGIDVASAAGFFGLVQASNNSSNAISAPVSSLSAAKHQTAPLTAYNKPPPFDFLFDGIKTISEESRPSSAINHSSESSSSSSGDALVAHSNMIAQLQSTSIF